MSGEAKCSNCQTPMALVGEEDLRVGGTTGFGGMLLGNFNQMSEHILSLEMYRCETCGKVDFYMPAGR